MIELTWKYVKPLKNQRAVEIFLSKYQISLPITLIQCLSVNNGGRPSKKIFDTDKGKEYVFKSLLSYNEDDKECIYNVYPNLFKGTSLFPIGTDAGGNFVCYDTSMDKYVLFKHETNTLETVVWNI